VDDGEGATLEPIFEIEDEEVNAAGALLSIFDG
jgi:hypothetical protein